jgi:hypothetical protein
MFWVYMIWGQSCNRFYTLGWCEIKLPIPPLTKEYSAAKKHKNRQQPFKIQGLQEKKQILLKSKLTCLSTVT